MNLIIRADAGAQLGTGHVMRCLALAQAWQDAGGRAIFVTAMEAPGLQRRLNLEGLEVLPLAAPPGSADDAIQTRNLAQKREASWIVVDGYHFGANYRRILKGSGLGLLLVDDHGYADHYDADMILNQNIHAHEGLYVNREPYARLLLGTRYVLLRREFLKWRDWKRRVSEAARNVLITLGGADPANVTLQVIQALPQVKREGLEVIAVVGASNPHYRELESFVRESQLPVRLKSNPMDMPELMAWADVAISAGGSTCWEMAFMGLPSIILILADHQRPIAEQLDKRGVAINLGWHETVSSAHIRQAITSLLVAEKSRVEMARRGKELVDGEGCARVLMGVQGRKLRLRPVREEEGRLLWEWANDPEVRAASFSTGPISWDEHARWFAGKLHNPTCHMLLALDPQDRPVGQVRFDMSKDGEAEIGVSIDKSKRGLGYGSYLIDLAVEEIFRTTSARAVHAFIKPGNKSSLRAFEKAKFKRLGVETVRGNLALHYVRAIGEPSDLQPSDLQDMNP